MSPDEFAAAVENIERIAALSLAPGDVVWIRSARNLSAEEATRIHEAAKTVFPNHMVMVTPPGLDLDLVNAEDSQ